MNNKIAKRLRTVASVMRHLSKLADQYSPFSGAGPEEDVRCPSCHGTKKQYDGGRPTGDKCHTCRGAGVVPASEAGEEVQSVRPRDASKRDWSEGYDPSDDGPHQLRKPSPGMKICDECQGYGVTTGPAAFGSRDITSKCDNCGGYKEVEIDDGDDERTATSDPHILVMDLNKWIANFKSSKYTNTADEQHDFAELIDVLAQYASMELQNAKLGHGFKILARLARE